MPGALLQRNVLHAQLALAKGLVQRRQIVREGGVRVVPLDGDGRSHLVAGDVRAHLHRA
jgi:hypothetical protein